MHYMLFTDSQSLACPTISPGAEDAQKPRRGEGSECQEPLEPEIMCGGVFSESSEQQRRAHQGATWGAEC